MKGIIRRLLPSNIYRALALIRDFKVNQELDRRFKGERDTYTLDPSLFENLSVVPTRTHLLERVVKGGVIAEVGVADGSFSEQILAICQPRKLYLIDLWPEASRYATMKRGVEERFGSQIESGIVEILHGFSYEMVERIPDSSLDFAYVDAAHDFENVRRDLEACRSKVKNDGMIGGDDYTRWSGNGLYRWGVVEAVNCFCNKHRWEMAYLTHEPGRHINYGLRRA